MLYKLFTCFMVNLQQSWAGRGLNNDYVFALFTEKAEVKQARGQYCTLQWENFSLALSGSKRKWLYCSYDQPYCDTHQNTTWSHLYF
ncbi:MAG: hypothetical protein CL912_21470 [Deltaproteobacteria bacterium]|nr:hypothetical protein [Deltaproteobacteria bacterium]